MIADNPPTENSTARNTMLGGLQISSRSLDVAGVKTSVLESGEGPPLVLLHGAIECGGIMWTPVVAKLAEHNHVVIPDAPGLGESSPAPRLDDDTFTRWFSTLLDELALERPALVAHSMLGSLAARFTTRHADLLSRLVVYGAPGVGPYKIPARLGYVAIRFSLRPTPRNAERFDRYALLDLDATRRLDPEWYGAFESYARTLARNRHVKRTMSQLISAGKKQIPDIELDGIDIPTSLLWGRHDRMVPLRIGETAAERHGWPLYVVEETAHAPHIEQPEAFVKTLAMTGAITSG
jgi:pimeloyl-ACP methyl ester carboxylesterase